MLDPRRLLTFRTVARAGSFSAAGRELALTQPAVSQQVAALERELGARLLHRGPGGLTLTDAGAVALEHAEALAERLALADAQLAELDDDAGPLPRTIRRAPRCGRSAGGVDQAQAEIMACTNPLFALMAARPHHVAMLEMAGYVQAVQLTRQRMNGWGPPELDVAPDYVAKAPRRSRAVRAVFSAVIPSFSRTSAPGALAPKRSIETVRSTQRSQP